MATYEFENAEDFCAKVAQLGIKDIGLKMVFQDADAGAVARGVNVLPGKQITVYGTLTAINEKDSLVFQEQSAQVIVALKTEYEELKAKVAERETELVKLIQEKAPKARIFNGQVKQ